MPQSIPIQELPIKQIDYNFMQFLSDSALFISANAKFIVAGTSALIEMINFYILRLGYLFVFSLGLWILLRGRIANFIDAFKISCHTVTLPLLLQTVEKATLINVPVYGWFTLLHIITTLFMVVNSNKH